MATQTIDNRFAEVQGMMKTLLTTPISKLTQRQLALLPVALTFGDCFYKETHDIEIGIRDLRSVHTPNSLNHLYDMLCLVGEYNDYNPQLVCEALQKHEDFIDVESTQFGRDYSPVLYLGLKQSYLTGEFNFMEKANDLAKDLVEVAKCNELHWSVLGKHEDLFVVPSKSLKRWVPMYKNDNVVTGYKEITSDHFRRFRVWW